MVVTFTPRRVQTKRRLATHSDGELQLFRQVPAAHQPGTVRPSVRPLAAVETRRVSAPARDARAPRQATAVRTRWVLLAVALGSMMSGLDSSISNTVLPVIATSLHADVAAAHWVMSIYLLVLSGLLLAFPLYYGNGLLYGMHGEIAPSQYPSGWYAADRVLAADPSPGRTLFLPWHEYMSLSFVRNENSVVASPAPSFFSTPVLVSADPEVPGIAPPTDPEQKEVSDLVAAGNAGRWAQVLATHHIKYLLLAREVDWSSYTYLDNQPGLVLVGDYSSIVLYRNSLVT